MPAYANVFQFRGGFQHLVGRYVFDGLLSRYDSGQPTLRYVHCNIYDVPEVQMPSDSPQTENNSPAFPKKMLIFTAMIALLIVSAFVFNSEVEDAFGHGIDVVMVTSLFVTGAVAVLWAAWFLLFSRWTWSRRLIACAGLFVLPILFLNLFRPINSGDATVARLEPIWASRPDAPEVSPDAVSTVDLKTETPNDFARFLGPDQNSIVAPDFRIDTAAFDTSAQIWKQPIGEGWSGFAARNGFAVTMEQRDDQECVTCYSIETGALQWLYEHRARHQDNMNLGRVGPRSTPTIHNGMVYAVGAVGNFVCLNGADGTVAWQVDLNSVLGLQLKNLPDVDGRTVHTEASSALSWGRSGSPLIVGDLVIVPGGGPKRGEIYTLLAFDWQSGDLIWKGGDEMIAYGSPVLATVAGIEQILMTAESRAMGFDPSTGQQLWDFPRPGETNGGANTSQLTVVSDNRVLTSKGYPDGGGEVIELTNEEGTLVPKSVWNNRRVLKTKLMSPLLYDGHTYALSNGFMECARLSDGKRIWKRRGRFGHGQMLLVNDQILLHSEFGTLYLIQPTNDGYTESGQFSTIDGVCWNTICLYGDRILVRSELEAACYQLSTQPISE